MRRRSRFSLRIAKPAWVITCCFVLAAWLVSLVVSVKFYGHRLSAAYEEGFFGLYWGGDADTRNCWLHNGFAPPWDGTGAGGSLDTGTTWEVYGPDLVLAPSTLRDNLEYGVFAQRTLGLRWPDARRDGAIILPLWMLAGIIVTPAMFSHWRRKRHPQGACGRCGYNLTGNLSGICPECGAKMWRPDQREYAPGVPSREPPT